MRADQRDGQFGQFRPIFASFPKSAAVNLRDGDAQERRRDIGPIVDVLIEGMHLPIAHQADRIDIEEQRGRAALGCRFGIIDMGLPERERKRLHLRRVLMEKKTQVGGGNVGGRKCQKHSQESEQIMKSRTGQCIAQIGSGDLFWERRIALWTIRCRIRCRIRCTIRCRIRCTVCVYVQRILPKYIE